MKKISVFVVAIALIMGLASCSSEPETIEGYWMTETGETVSFNSDGKAIVDGLSLDYSIYDEDKLSISFLGLAEEYKFDIEKDVLTLTSLNNNSIIIYYRDEVKQAEIQEDLEQIAIEQAEQERIQQEAEAEAQAQRDYEEYVRSKKARLDTIDSKITENRSLIVEVQGWITDIDSDIAEVSQSSDELADEQIQNLKDYQNRLRDDIAEIEQDIVALEVEKNEIITELKELGEY